MNTTTIGSQLCIGNQEEKGCLIGMSREGTKNNDTARHQPQPRLQNTTNW